MARELPSVLELVRHGGLLCPEPARGDAAGARGAAVELVIAPRVTARGLAREPWRGIRAGAARARGRGR